MREATEQVSYYGDPYSTNIFTGGNVASEDEISFSFASASSSHHSLLVVLSPTPQGADKRQLTVLRDSSSCSSADEHTGGVEKEGRIRRQRRIGSVEEINATILTQLSGSLGEDTSFNPPASDNERDCLMKGGLSSMELVRGEELHSDKVEHCPPEQPKKPQRRERRIAVASYLQNPLELPQQQLCDDSPSVDKRKEGDDENIKEEKVPDTPRRRKAYSIKDRLQNPLSVQLDLGDAIGREYESEPTPTFTPHAMEEFLPAEDQPHFEFEDVCRTPDMSHSPLGSPRPPGETLRGIALFRPNSEASSCSCSQCVFVVGW